MKLPFILTRESRRSLLIGLTPYQVLIAGLRKRDGTNVVIDTAVEFKVDDEAGIRRWLNENFEHHSSWLPVVCGVASRSTLIQRHSIVPRRLAEPGYIAELCNIPQQDGQRAEWKTHVLTPLEGQPVPQQGGQRPALIAGISHEEIHAVQQRLLDYRMLPYRLEVSTLPLFAALYDRQSRSNDQRAIVVVAISQEQTTTYILGKEGVHTPAQLPHGFTSVVQAARKELHLNEAQEVANRLHDPDEEILLRASKFLRAIGRDLKSVIDSYELTTGQPVGDIYFDYLPPSLDWMAEPLSQIVGRPRYTIKCNEWLPEVGVSPTQGLPEFGSHWFSTLSLLASIQSAPGEESAPAQADYQGPWRVDCRLSAELPSTDLIGRKFIVNAVAGMLAGSAVLFGAWQGYSAYVLRHEIGVLRQRIAENTPAYAAYEKSEREFDALSTNVDAAWELLHTPYLVTDYLLELGRSKPGPLRIDSVTQNVNGVSVRGEIAEPSNRASQTLGTYVRELRANPAFATIFSSITLVDMNRAATPDAFVFEIQFRLRSNKN